MSVPSSISVFLNHSNITTGLPVLTLIFLCGCYLPAPKFLGAQLSEKQTPLRDL